MLPSCGVTVIKRQHTRGYYVSTNPRQHVGKGEAVIGKDETKQIVSEESALMEVAEPTVVETPATNNEQAHTLDLPVIDDQNDQAAIFVKTSSTERTFSLRSITEKAPMLKKIDVGMKKIKSNSAAPTDDEALSLLWIVILVLLVVWALGLAGGGWGLGGLINILLVIALVLLILWLLRII